MPGISDVFQAINGEIRASVLEGLGNTRQEMDDRLRAQFTRQTQGSRPGAESPEFQWIPTTEVALRARKTFPGGNVGAQQAYLRNAVTLVDTGALRDSLTSGLDESADVIESYHAFTAPYAAAVQNGSVLVIDGKSHDVPPRPIAYVTEVDADFAMAKITEALSRG